MNPVLKALHGAPVTCLALEDGRRAFSYGELRRRVEQEARWHASHPLQRCGLLADNGSGWVIADLALMAADRLHVPIPEYFTPAQVAHIVRDAALDYVLTDRGESFAEIHTDFEFLARSEYSGLALLKRRTSAPSHSPKVPAGTGKITYTSGSTGESKGVCLSTEAIVNVASSLAQATTEFNIKRHMCVLPLATLLENIAGVYVPLLLQAAIVVRPASEVGMSFGAIDPERLLHALHASRPDSLVLVPELLRLLTALQQRGAPLPSMKFVAVGGAAVSPELLAEAQSLGLPAFEGYGLSECASVVCLNTLSANRQGSVGKPLPHAAVRIGESGELCVRGAVMRGYLGEQSSSVTIAGEIATGDLGEIDADGFVYVRGRRKHMFITSMGRNVSPEWVERELTRDGAIARALVVGEARPHAAALIVPSVDASEQQIRIAVANANSRLPEYAQVRRWACLPEPPTLNNRQLTANGRLRRQFILQRHGSLVDSLYCPVSGFQERVIHAVL